MTPGIDLKLVLLAIVAIAFASIYIIQWFKTGPFKIPQVVSWVLSPILNVGLALVTALGVDLGIPFSGFLIVGALAWAMAQAGYEIILKHVPIILTKYADKLETQVAFAKVEMAIKVPPPTA